MKENYEHITIEDISNSLDVFKNGGWIEKEIPSKWHYEEVDDICECCGTNCGKIKTKVVDEYKTVKEYIKPGEWNPDSLILNPNIMNKLMEEEKDVNKN